MKWTQSEDELFAILLPRFKRGLNPDYAALAQKWTDIKAQNGVFEGKTYTLSARDRVSMKNHQEYLARSRPQASGPSDPPKPAAKPAPKLAAAVVPKAAPPVASHAGPAPIQPNPSIWQRLSMFGQLASVGLLTPEQMVEWQVLLHQASR